MAIMPRAKHAVVRAALSPDDLAAWDRFTICSAGHHLLYRFFDEAGRLLYVGITWTPRERWRRHRKKAHWWPAVAFVVVECHASEYKALCAELAAIKAEAPLHNKRGVPA